MHFFQTSLLHFVPHAFTTQASGDVGLGPTAADNRQRLVTTLGKSRLITLEEVHGTNIVEVGSETLSGTQADGLFTRDPNVLLGIYVADCLPILFADTQKRVVGAVHAGWRGTVGGIVSKMIKALNVEPADLCVAIGPGIGSCCFEVQEDVAAAFKPHFASHLITRSARTFVDLQASNMDALQQAGVRHIEVINCCTVCSGDFFSFRRDGALLGHQAGVIGL
jgi:polyphenol oxidase